MHAWGVLGNDDWLIPDFRGYHRHRQEAYWCHARAKKGVRSHMPSGTLAASDRWCSFTRKEICSLLWSMAWRLHLAKACKNNQEHIWNVVRGFSWPELMHIQFPSRSHRTQGFELSNIKSVAKATATCTKILNDFEPNGSKWWHQMMCRIFDHADIMQSYAVIMCWTWWVRKEM
jgi:hypothetical protein